MPAEPDHSLTVSAGMKRPAPSTEVHHAITWPNVRRLLPSGRPLNILDAGSGSGQTTALLTELGHHVIGIEVLAHNVEAARRNWPQLRFELRSCYEDLSDLRPDGGWGVVVSCEVVEHLLAPLEFLRNMHQNLRSGGTLIVTTPYHGYLKNLALSLIDGWDRHFHVLVTGGHVKFFSARTMRSALREAGFAEPVFRYAGRVPYLWKDLACRAIRP